MLDVGLTNLEEVFRGLIYLQEGSYGATRKTVSGFRNQSCDLPQILLAILTNGLSAIQSLGVPTVMKDGCKNTRRLGRAFYYNESILGMKKGHGIRLRRRQIL